VKVEITSSRELYGGFLTLEETHLRHETPDGGMSPQIMRLNVERGDGAAVLVVNRDKGTVVLTRQFRYANWKRGDGGSSLEIPAGTVALGERPEDVARSELLQEIGYDVADLRPLFTFYASPGTSTERVFLYYAEVAGDHKVADGGGLDTEHEYIEVVEMPIDEALDALDRGLMADAKTIIALQWFRESTSAGHK
jgi:ADP-ribose pyrophosphatase